MPFICRLTWHDSFQPIPDKHCRQAAENMRMKKGIKRIATDKKFMRFFIQFFRSLRHTRVLGFVCDPFNESQEH